MVRSGAAVKQVANCHLALFLDGWMRRLAGAGAKNLPHSNQLFWQQVSSQCALNLHQGSSLLGLNSNADYSTYLILTTLLYTNSLFAKDDFIVAYGIPSSFMQQHDDFSNATINQAVLDSLQLSQPLMLICENMERYSYNSNVHNMLSAANPNWHEVKSELSKPVTAMKDPHIHNNSDEAYFAPFVGQLFSGRQIKAQLQLFQ